VVENKEVPDSNIGVPPVRKYANYRTLLLIVIVACDSFRKTLCSANQCKLINKLNIIYTQLFFISFIYCSKQCTECSISSLTLQVSCAVWAFVQIDNKRERCH
jgi:hypothetical protein